MRSTLLPASRAGTPAQIQRARLHGDVTRNGVAFDWDHVTKDGARFVLLREPHHTDADIARAAMQLYRDRCVAGPIVVAPIEPMELPRV